MLSIRPKGYYVNSEGILGLYDIYFSEVESRAMPVYWYTVFLLNNSDFTKQISHLSHHNS